MTRKLVWLSAMMVVSISAWAAVPLGSVNITLTQETRKYCHIVRFPQGWAFPRVQDDGELLSFDHSSKFEFRLEGALSSNYLVGVYKTLINRRYEATNWYRLSFSNPDSAVIPVSREIWEPATVVPIVRKGVFQPGQTVANNTRAVFHGLQFIKSGNFWAQPSDFATRLSPDGRWLILLSTTDQSKTGTLEDGPTRVFLDVFNAETGKKVITIGGVYTGSRLVYDVDGYLGSSGWVTERYFILQLGEHKERCLVCEFGAAR